MNIKIDIEETYANEIPKTNLLYYSIELQLVDKQMTNAK